MRNLTDKITAANERTERISQEENYCTPSTSKRFDMNNLRESKDPMLEHKWTSRRHPTKECNLKDSYTELAQVKIKLYEAELLLAKERRDRESELHELQKENIMLEIKKKRN